MLHRAVVGSAGGPEMRLRVLMKDSPAWVIPLIKVASAEVRNGAKAVQASPPRTLQLSLVRSVAQSALRKGSSFWGR